MESDENSVFHEEKFRDPKGFNRDLNGFLKSEQFGRNLSQTPCLQAQLNFSKYYMATGGANSVRRMIANHLRQGK